MTPWTRDIWVALGHADLSHPDLVAAGARASSDGDIYDSPYEWARATLAEAAVDEMVELIVYSHIDRTMDYFDAWLRAGGVLASSAAVYVREVRAVLRSGMLDHEPTTAWRHWQRCLRVLRDDCYVTWCERDMAKPRRQA